VPRRNARRIAQPMLSFAIHASLIALAVGQTAPAGTAIVDPVVYPTVIYDPDDSRTTSKVEPGTDSPLPRPICECTIPIPGPLQPGELPGRIEPNPWPLPGHPGITFGDSTGVPGSPAPVGVYREEDLSDSPAVLRLPDPVYPPALRIARVEGVVQVTYVVDALGGVEAESITIVSSDHPSMSESVRAALLQARFHPGKVRGTPVRSLVRQTIRFSLMPL
jgi:TonB family protein